VVTAVAAGDVHALVVRAANGEVTADEDSIHAMRLTTALEHMGHREWPTRRSSSQHRGGERSSLSIIQSVPRIGPDEVMLLVPVIARVSWQ
jgi:hypothetical protein